LHQPSKIIKFISIRPWFLFRFIFLILYVLCICLFSIIVFYCYFLSLFFLSFSLFVFFSFYSPVFCLVRILICFCIIISWREKDRSEHFCLRSKIVFSWLNLSLFVVMSLLIFVLVCLLFHSSSASFSTIWNSLMAVCESEAIRWQDGFLWIFLSLFQLFLRHCHDS